MYVCMYVCIHVYIYISCKWGSSTFPNTKRFPSAPPLFLPAADKDRQSAVTAASKDVHVQISGPRQIVAMAAQTQGYPCPPPCWSPEPMCLRET